MLQNLCVRKSIAAPCNQLIDLTKSFAENLLAARALQPPIVAPHHHLAAAWQLPLLQQQQATGGAASVKLITFTLRFQAPIAAEARLGCRKQQGLRRTPGGTFGPSSGAAMPASCLDDIKKGAWTPEVISGGCSSANEGSDRAGCLGEAARGRACCGRCEGSSHSTQKAMLRLRRALIGPGRAPWHSRRCKHHHALPSWCSARGIRACKPLACGHAILTTTITSASVRVGHAGG